MSRMEVCHYSYFRWCGYFRGPWVSFITTDEFSVRVAKITSRIDLSWTQSYLSVFNLFLTQGIMAILSKGSKPDNVEPHNSLKLSLTNIWGLRSKFVECESFLESNYPDILALCETNLDDSIDSEKFSVRGYLPLIQKDSRTHVHGLEVYVKEGFPFARDLSPENSRFLRMFSTSFTSLSVLLLFPLSITFFVVLHSFWFYFI